MEKEVLFLVIFDIEVLPDLYILRSFQTKNVALENWSVGMYARVSVCVSANVWLCGENLELYIFKINKDRNTKFYTQHQKQYR